MQLPNSPVSPTPANANKDLYNGGSEWQNDFAGMPDYYQTFYRNYNAAIGRFVGVDPIPESAEDMSVYQYAGNNPIMGNDPLGDFVLKRAGATVPVYNGQPSLSGLRFTRFNVYAIGNSGENTMASSDYEDADIGSHGRTVSNEAWQAAVNYLLKSDHGGNITSFGSTIRFGTEVEEINAGIAYMDEHGAWEENDFAHSAAAAVLNYDMANGNQLVTMSQISRYLPEVSIGQLRSGNLPSWWGDSESLINGQGESHLNDFMAGFMNPPYAGFTPSSATSIANLESDLVESVLKNSGSASREMAVASKFLGKTLGVGGVALTAYNAYNQKGGFTSGDWVKVRIGVALIVNPIGWVGIGYAGLDILTEISTGTSITDRIGNGVNNMKNKW